MKRLSRLVLIFTLLFAFFILLPPFLSRQFGPYPYMKTQDVFDLFTPLVLIPIYWLLFEIEPGKQPGRAETVVFLVIAALWAHGQGMHLAANSIDNLIEGKTSPDVLAALAPLRDVLPGSPVAALTYFYDEVLSHYLWYGAVMAMAALLIYRQWRNPFGQVSAGLGFPIVAGVLHGINFALSVLEGQIIPLGFPFSALVVLFTLIWGRDKLRQQPILAFFFVAFALATVVFLVWWLVWGCFVEPLDVLADILKGTRPLCP